MMERVDMLVSMVMEYFIFIYYTNSTMNPRKSYFISNLGITAGYIILYIVTMYNIPALNAAAFLINIFIMLYLLFETKLKNAAVQTLIIAAIMMVTEGILSMLTNIGAEANSLEGRLLSEKMIHAVFSKTLYFIGILIFKYLSKDKKKYANWDGFFGFMIIPVFTIAALECIMQVFDSINEQQRIMFAFLAGLGFAANIIVYIMYDKTLLYNKEIQELQEEKFKNNLELSYCNMLEDKLQQTKVMSHDFKEHLRVLETYINSDNSSAIDYLKSINIQNDEISILNYTNNKVLNILLSEKQKICINKGIELKVHASDTELGFMQDIDIVSIFSNLLNNAVESCDRSEKKIIYVNLYKMNNAFLVIKIDNSCDVKPIEENGFYKTTKITGGEHGIGLKSVARTVKKYKGDLRMEYDDENRMFSAVIMFPLNK